MSDEQRIFRITKDRDYSVIANAPIRDKRLTWAARGLLVYLLSRPDNWEVQMKNLFGESPMGRDHVQGLVKELEEFGYMIRTEERNKNGQWRWVTEVHEMPIHRNGFSGNGKTVNGKPVHIISTDIQNTNNDDNELSSCDTRQPTTPGAIYMFSVLEKEADAAGRRKPTRFSSLAMKSKFEEAEDRLGTGNVERAVNTGVAKGIVAVGNLTAWVSKWSTNNTTRTESMFEKMRSHGN